MPAPYCSNANFRGLSGVEKPKKTFESPRSAGFIQISRAGGGVPRGIEGRKRIGAHDGSGMSESKTILIYEPGDVVPGPLEGRQTSHQARASVMMRIARVILTKLPGYGACSRMPAVTFAAALKRLINEAIELKRWRQCVQLHKCFSALRFRRGGRSPKTWRLSSSSERCAVSISVMATSRVQSG